MHVDLNPKNRVKILEACGQLNMSANQVANLYFDAVEVTELVYLITAKSTLPNGSHPKEVPRVLKKRIRIQIGGD